MISGGRRNETVSVFSVKNCAVNLLPDGNQFLALNGTDRAGAFLMRYRRQAMNPLFKHCLNELALA